MKKIAICINFYDSNLHTRAYLIYLIQSRSSLPRYKRTTVFPRLDHAAMSDHIIRHSTCSTWMHPAFSVQQTFQPMLTKIEQRYLASPWIPNFPLFFILLTITFDKNEPHYPPIRSIFQANLRYNKASRWRPRYIFLDGSGDVIAMEVTRKRARRIRVTPKRGSDLENEPLKQRFIYKLQGAAACRNDSEHVGDIAIRENKSRAPDKETRDNLCVTWSITTAL